MSEQTEVQLNKDGLPIGQPVTFEQIAAANYKRTKQIPAKVEEPKPKAPIKPKSK